MRKLCVSDKKYHFRTKNCVKTNQAAVYSNQSEVHVRIKCNPFRIENFYKNTLILSTSFIGLSAPLYVFLSKDWSESTQEQSSSKFKISPNHPCIWQSEDHGLYGTFCTCLNMASHEKQNWPIKV